MTEDGAGSALRLSRRRLLRRGVVAGGAVAATGGVVAALPMLADSAASARDSRILNYVLRLERLKAAFYEEAAQQGVGGGELQQFATVLARHERRHVSFIDLRLAGEATAPSSYDFGDATSDPDRFASAARALEEAAVAAYIGQGANLSRGNIVPFAQITSVEARHAAWIADILEEHPAPLAADEAMTPSEVRAAIDELGFET